jgi:hypothetical protein
LSNPAACGIDGSAAVREHGQEFGKCRVLDSALIGSKPCLGDARGRHANILVLDARSRPGVHISLASIKANHIWQSMQLNHTKAHSRRLLLDLSQHGCSNARRTDHIQKQTRHRRLSKSNRQRRPTAPLLLLRLLPVLRLLAIVDLAGCRRL